MKGNSEGNFNRGTITVAEAIAMAARLHNISSGEVENLLRFAMVQGL
jgi:hypothetical protein